MVKDEATETLVQEQYIMEEIHFLPYERAKKIVAEIVDEEHISEPNRRIFTVYDHHGKSLCWFDAAEVMAEAGVKRLEDAYDFLLHSIPEWVERETEKL